MNTNALPHRDRLFLAGLAGLVAAVLLPGPVLAQSSKSDRNELAEVYRKGKTAYDLGDFEEAIEYFKRAYAIQPHEAHLYNIAQAYRQSGDCRNALFFYKRYVAVGGVEARHYRVVQRRIEELSASCEAQEEPPDEAPDEPGARDSDRGESDAASGSEAGGATMAVEGEADGAEARGPRAEAVRDPVLAASLELGGALLDFGALEVTGTHFSLGVGGGYPLDFGKLGVTLGGLFTYTPVPWSNELNGASGTSSLLGVLGNVGIRYDVAGKLALRLDLGGGVLLLSGLSPGDVFLPDGQMATGVLGMVHVRGGVGLEYRLTESLVFGVSPLVYSFSPPKDGLRAEIDKLARFEFIAGLGYRL